MRIGDLVKFKPHCTWHSAQRDRVFLVEYASADFLALHEEREYGWTAKQNFILVSKANENR